MKGFIATAICTMAFGSVSAQFVKPAPPPMIAVVMEKGKRTGIISYLPQKKNAAGFRKNAVGGYFTDVRKQPVKGVRAFIYMPDSSIAASGFTDAEGYFETNSVQPGRYSVKITYPTSKAALWVTNVPIIKDHITEVSFRKMEVPATDTTVYYSEIAPKEPEAKKK